MADGRTPFPQQSRLKPGSQNQLIVAALADGEWHTTADVHRAAGFSRLNSRVSELRTKHGYRIEQRHIPGAGSGPHAHEYRLVGTPGGQVPRADATGLSPSTSTATSPGRSTCPPDARSEASPAGEQEAEASTYEQLSLVAA